MNANCYLVWDQATKEALVIDPGDAGDFIINKVRDFGLLAKVVIATHGHFDHIMAVAEICLALKIPFMANSNDEFLLKKAPASAQRFTREAMLPAPALAKNLRKGDFLKFGKSQFRVMETPGHTPGSICFYLKKDNSLICGDLMFADGRQGRSDFYYSDKKLLEKSILEISKLPQNTVVYPGHGPEFILGKWIGVNKKELSL